MKKTFEVIPAIDIIDGACVRLTQGNYTQKEIFSTHPVEIAKVFQDQGFERLHLVDLDGAKKGKVVHWDILDRISNQTNLKVDFSGGINSLEDAQKVLSSGGYYISIGSLALFQEELFLRIATEVGKDKIILGCDVKNFILQYRGWTENSQVSVFDFIEKYLGYGFQHFFSTDISKDGMMQGIAQDLYEQLLLKFSQINLIASGGVHSIKDIKRAKELGCSGIIVGKSLLNGTLNFQEIKNLIQ